MCRRGYDASIMVRRRHLAVAAGAALLITLLVACGGGGSTPSPGVPIPNPTTGPTTAPPTTSPTSSPTSTPTPPGSSSTTISTSAGGTDGEPGEFTPTEGDTSSGGQGQAVDGVTCDPTMSDNYHIHIYLGLYVNGTLVALPAGVGMENPGAPGSGGGVPGFVNSATCFYHLHTHDQSGIVHVEDPDPNGVPVTGTLYTLKTFLDEWGITADSDHFGPFTGPVRVFTSGQVYRGDDSGTNFTTMASDLTYWGSDPNNIPLYSHEVIDIEVGPTWPTSLPNVYFYLQY